MQGRGEGVSRHKEKLIIGVFFGEMCGLKEIIENKKIVLIFVLIYFILR